MKRVKWLVLLPAGILLLTFACKKDKTPPVITLIGSPSVTVCNGFAYTDAGATAVDDVDGDITDKIEVTNPVNTNVNGEYIVRYNVSDKAGNKAEEVTRTVTVIFCK